MNSNTIPIDLDRAKTDYLLERLKQRTLTREQAVELQRLLEIERDRALKRGNTDLAMKLAYFLIGLNGYIAGKFDLKDDFTITKRTHYQKESS